MSSESQHDQQQYDPSIYQYDQVYDEIKNKTSHSIESSTVKGNNKNQNLREEERERSRQKLSQKTHQGGSRYIKKMKQIVQERQSIHQRANQKKLQRQNLKLGIKPEEVFVTESYLKKKKQQKEKQIKQKEKQKYDQEHSIMNKTKGIHDFTRKLLEDQNRRRY